MLELLLIATAFLLIVTNWFAFRSKHPGGWITSLCLVTAFGQICLGFLIPLVSLEALLLIVALVIWQASPRGPKFFLSLSVGSAVLVFGIATVMALRSEREFEQLRAEYPYQSMESRLPLLKVSLRERPLGPDVEARLDRLELGGVGWLRERRLMHLHEEKVSLFLNSFGFGYSRMLPGPSKDNLLIKQVPVPTQPGPRIIVSTSPGEWKLAIAEDQITFGPLLEIGIHNFAKPLVFGYLKDRQHVAGFQPHQFSEVPESDEDWKVQTLDLVGILLEAEPRVYVSDKLPSMAEVGKVPTRPLDKFEAVGLTTLQEGEDLWITREGAAARMLGAIRSSGQCITCHGGERGDLLGAFSYTLKQAKPVEIKSAQLER